MDVERALRVQLSRFRTAGSLGVDRREGGRLEIWGFGHPVFLSDAEALDLVEEMELFDAEDEPEDVAMQLNVLIGPYSNPGRGL